ncbi:putative Transmembrane emp24 domain-containing protein p24delta9 [Cocos nucifera]|uniref:Putative Transmembrane emp24 domain-containing protein p24delta9 n=1 Tax=Cocos nucifera TaxID=13894 RepID=A0A8K0MYG6_COCNU|nr:putative Transmembrane emp24 domain-containing protein p24delta9 [Cocos nucifera]
MRSRSRNERRISLPLAFRSHILNNAAIFSRLSYSSPISISFAPAPSAPDPIRAQERRRRKEKKRERPIFSFCPCVNQDEMEPGIGGSAVLRLVLALAVASLLPSPTQSVHFDLQSGKPKCITEDIKLHAMAVGKYIVVKSDDSSPLPDTHRVIARISSPDGNIIHSADNVESGNFAFNAYEAGEYLACFWTPVHKPPTTVTLELDWRTGIATKDWTNIAKKEHLDVMELELFKLRDTIQSIHEEMFDLRLREEEMQGINRTTNSRMAWLSLLSLVVCLSVAGMQLWHLKTFFERKKLL